MTVRKLRLTVCLINNKLGALVATGSADMSLKVVDVSKMNNRSDSKDEDRPVIRTLYDHAGVSDLQLRITLSSLTDSPSVV